MTDNSKQEDTSLDGLSFLFYAIRGLQKHHSRHCRHEMRVIFPRSSHSTETNEERREHKLILEADWQKDQYRIAIVSEHVQGKTRDESRRLPIMVALLFEMSSNRILEEQELGSAYRANTLGYTIDDFGEPRLWYNEICRITCNEDDVLEMRDVPEFKERVVLDCLEKRDPFDFKSPLRYRRDRIERFGEQAMIYIEDRMRELVPAMEPRIVPIKHK